MIAIASRVRAGGVMLAFAWRGGNCAAACAACGSCCSAWRSASPPSPASARCAPRSTRGLAADGARILGGDLEIDGGAQPLPDALRAWLRRAARRLSDVVQMRSMLVAPSGERQLVELKAVDRRLAAGRRGRLGPRRSRSATRRWREPSALVAEPAGRSTGWALHPGDTVRLGNATLTVRGAS